MNLSVSLDFTFTPAEKRVYAWKLIHTMLILFIFLATFNITGDYEKGLIVAFAGAVAGAVAGAIAVADVGEKNKKYEISFLSNALSALIQMGLIWLGLYLTQHIKIMFV